MKKRKNDEDINIYEKSTMHGLVNATPVRIILR